MAAKRRKIEKHPLEHLRKPKPKPPAKEVGDLLQSYFKRTGQSDKLNRIAIIAAYKKLLGPSIVHATLRIFVRDATLFLKIEGSSLQHELFSSRSQLIERLNEEAGQDIIDSIRFI